MARLLLIEDEPDTRDMLALLLELGGYAVTSVASEPAALDALRRGGYDLVLADLMLGRSNATGSWQYVGRIADLARPAPVGLLSGANGVNGDPAAHGLAFALRKPCTRDKLFAQLAATLQLPELPATTAATLREYFACIERGDYERFRTLLAPDFVYRLPGTDPRFSNEICGLDEFIAFTQATFARFGEPKFELTAMRPLPHGALVEYIGSWREGTSTRQMPGAVMFELVDGRIRRAEVRVNVDEIT